MSNSIIQKMLEVAASYDGVKYVLGGDGSREGGTDCGKFIQDSANGAGIPWNSRYVPHMIDEAKNKGIWRDPANYVPQPGDAAVVMGDNHVVLVDANGIRQAGSGTGYVYHADQTPQEMFGDVTGYISFSNYFEGASPFELFARANTINEVGVPVTPLADMAQETQENPDASFSERFQNAWNQSVPGGFSRTSWLNFSTTSENNYVFSKEDSDYVNKHLPGNKVAQTFVYSNASSREQLEALVQMKKEDLELEQKVALSPININSFGTIAGMLVGEISNPVNYVPLALLNKGALATRMIKQGLANATLNTLDSNVRERLIGYEQDYKVAALTGGIVGAALPAVGRLIKEAANAEAKKMLQGLEGDMMRIGEDSKNIIDGKTSSATVGDIKKVVALHTKDYTVDNKPLQTLLDNGKAVVVSKNNLTKLRKIFKQPISENTKAFHVNGMTVFIKEAIEGMDDKAIRGLLLHEVGVHGLNKVAKQPLIEIVNQAVQKPTGLWKEALERATANTPEGMTVEPEEILGYFVELTETKGKGGYFSKIKTALKTMFDDKEISDTDVVDIIRNNTTKIIDGHKGYQVLEDGSIITNEGLKQSANNILNPNNYVKLLNEDPFLVAQAGLPLGKTLGNYFENSFLHKTPFGAMINSKSATLRKIGGVLVEDARRRFVNGMGRVTNLPAETLKKALSEEFAPYLYDIQNDLMTYMCKTYGIAGAQLPKNIDDTWKRIVQYHDHVYAGHTVFDQTIPEELKSIAKRLNVLEKAELDVAERFGFISKDARECFDTGTRRIANKEKWHRLLSSYPDVGSKKGLEKLQKDLEKYALEAMQLKRFENTKVLQKIIDKENEVNQASFKAALKDWEGKGQFIGQPKPTFVPKEMNDEALNTFLKDEAHKWAYGMIDHNTSNLDVMGRNGNNYVLNFLHHRVRMDTSHEMILNGKTFSFDNDLRSYDFSSILKKTSDRWAGEIALFNSFSDSKISFDNLIDGAKSVEASVGNYRKVIEKELEQSGATAKQIKNNLEAFDFSIKALRGLYTGNGDYGYFDAISSLIRNISFARLGGNFGFNQFGELNGTMAYCGARSLISVFPYLTKPFSKAMYGKEVTEKGMEQMAEMFSKDMSLLSIAKQRLLGSSVGQMIDPLSLRGSVIDKLNDVVKVATTVTSKLSYLPQLTARMTHDAKWYTYLDMLKFTKGENVGWFGRTPFSAKKLAQIGISDAESFRSKLAGYLSEDGNYLDLCKMKEQDPAFYYQCYQFIDNQVKRTLTMDTIGNRNLLAGSNAFAQMFFQFKSFTNLTTNAQIMNKLTHREIDGMLSTIYGLFTAAGVTSLRYWSDSYSKHPNDMQAQQAYRDKYLTIDNLARQAVFRHAIISGVTSNLTDTAAILGLEDWTASRTTVDADRRKQYLRSDIASNLGRAVSQLPAIQTAGDMLDTPINLGTNGLNKKDLKTLFQLAPLQSYFPMQYLINETLRRADLPEK